MTLPDFASRDVTERLDAAVTGSHSVKKSWLLIPYWAEQEHILGIIKNYH